MHSHAFMLHGQKAIRALIVNGVACEQWTNLSAHATPNEGGCQGYGVAQPIAVYVQQHNIVETNLG